MSYAKASAILLMALLVAAGALSSPAHAEVSFNFFYSNLSHDGSWMVSGQYGRVWQPGVYAAGWNPYYDGHWVYTDLGWTWVSDYEWGSIAYHYGTWVMDPAFGWVWVPGYVWAPAWVVFRTGPDYIGWAPVNPGFSVGISGTFVEPADRSFVFVSSGDFLAPRVRERVVPYSRTGVIVRNTKVVNNLVVERNVIVNRGPDLSTIERASGRTVRPVSIERVPRAAPSPRVTRADLRIDPEREGRRLRAAEPVSDTGSPESFRQPGPGRHDRSAPRATTEEERRPRRFQGNLESDKPTRSPESPDGRFLQRRPDSSRKTPTLREPSSGRQQDATPRDTPSSGKRLSRPRGSSPQSVAPPATKQEKGKPVPEKRPPQKKDRKKDKKSSGSGGGGNS